MKQTDLIVLGLAGVAVWMIFQARKGTTSGPAKTGSNTGSTGAASSWVNEVFDAGGGQFGNGWRYFDNGTAIDQEGNYYFGGQRVYTASLTA